MSPLDIPGEYVGGTCCLHLPSEGTELKTTQLGQGHIQVPRAIPCHRAWQTWQAPADKSRRDASPVCEGRGAPWGPMESREEARWRGWSAPHRQRLGPTLSGCDWEDCLYYFRANLCSPPPGKEGVSEQFTPSKLRVIYTSSQTCQPTPFTAKHNLLDFIFETTRSSGALSGDCRLFEPIHETFSEHLPGAVPCPCP